MANPILVTGAAGRVAGVGRTVVELLLKQGKMVRAMVRSEDERAQALRALGAEVLVGNLLDLDSMHRAIAGCDTMYFGMSVRMSDDIRTLTGREPLSVQEFVRENAAAFTASAKAKRLESLRMPRCKKSDSQIVNQESNDSTRRGHLCPRSTCTRQLP